MKTEAEVKEMLLAIIQRAAAARQEHEAEIHKWDWDNLKMNMLNQERGELASMIGLLGNVLEMSSDELATFKKKIQQ